MRISIIILLLTVTLLELNIKSSTQDVILDNDTYDLEYSFGNSNDYFEKLASINIRKLKEVQSAYLSSSSSQQPSTQVYSDALNEASRKRLVDELQLQISPILRLRVCKRGICVASSYTNLRHLLKSNNIQLNLTIHISLTNNINSITIKSETNKNNGDQNLNLNGNFYLTINANIANIKPASVPDTQTYIERVRKEMEAKKESAQENNKSFLSKYWYYIVPVVIIVFLMNLVNPEQAGGGAAR